jgi:HD superfamily phosphohydrolase
MSRIYERRLYKRALTVGSEQVPVAAYQDGVPLEKSREYAGRIAELAGVRPHEVLVDIPSVPHEMLLAVRVRNRYSETSFEEISPRVRTLNETRREQWRLGVYTLPAFREPVADATCEVLHIRKPTRQDTLF